MQDPDEPPEKKLGIKEIASTVGFLLLVLWLGTVIAPEWLRLRLQAAGDAVAAMATAAAAVAVYFSVRQLELQRKALDDGRETLIEDHRLQTLARIRDAYATMIFEAVKVSLFVQDNLALCTEEPSDNSRRAVFLQTLSSMEDELHTTMSRADMLDSNADRSGEMFALMVDIVQAFRKDNRVRYKRLSQMEGDLWADIFVSAVDCTRSRISASLTAEQLQKPIEQVSAYAEWLEATHGRETALAKLQAYREQLSSGVKRAPTTDPVDDDGA